MSDVHRGDQSVLGAVGDLEGLVLAVDRKHREHRPKISSCAMRMPGATRSKMVGST